MGDSGKQHTEVAPPVIILHMTPRLFHTVRNLVSECAGPVNLSFATGAIFHV